MSVFFRRRGEPPATVDVTITGAGNATYCYAIINGTKQYSAGTHKVNAGDTITFGVYGKSLSIFGSVTIDGAEVLKVTSDAVKTYDWTVPSGISTIEIEMTVAPFPNPLGIITVTTS